MLTDTLAPASLQIRATQLSSGYPRPKPPRWRKLPGGGHENRVAGRTGKLRNSRGASTKGDPESLRIETGCGRDRWRVEWDAGHGTSLRPHQSSVRWIQATLWFRRKTPPSWLMRTTATPSWRTEGIHRLGDNLVTGPCPPHSGTSTPAFRRFRLSPAASKWKPPRPWDNDTVAVSLGVC